MKKWTVENKRLYVIRQRRAAKSKAVRSGGRSFRRGSVIDHLVSISRVAIPRLGRDETDLEFRVPQIFSVIDNPRETLKFIATVAQLTKLIGVKRFKSVRFDHSEIVRHDLAAEILLGVAGFEVKQRARYRNVNFIFYGSYPEDERKARLIRKMGVVKKLKVESAASLSELSEIKIFDQRGVKEHRVEAGVQDAKNKIAAGFVDHINSCLRAVGRALTVSAREQLVNFLGEIIGNAEDHSGAKSWHVCGYLDDSDELAVDEIRFCEIVIYNFGKSFADTFNDLDPKSYAFSLVRPYIEHHSRFSFFSKTWARSDLITLAALQSHISCKNLDETSDRGQGTVDLIEFFQKVARECVTSRSKEAKMALVTGNTHITFDERYQIKMNEEGREVIAFNESNDLYQKPDGEYVQHLSDVHFPGALIAIRFPLKYRDTQIVDELSAEVENEH